VCVRMGDQSERSGQHVLSRGGHNHVRLDTIGLRPMQVQDDGFNGRALTVVSATILITQGFIHRLLGISVGSAC
jgi:hypothetical protein